MRRISAVFMVVVILFTSCEEETKTRKKVVFHPRVEQTKEPVVAPEPCDDPKVVYVKDELLGGEYVKGSGSNTSQSLWYVYFNVTNVIEGEETKEYSGYKSLIMPTQYFDVNKAINMILPPPYDKGDYVGIEFFKRINVTVNGHSFN